MLLAIKSTLAEPPRKNQTLVYCSPTAPAPELLNASLFNCTNPIDSVYIKIMTTFRISPGTEECLSGLLQFPLLSPSLLSAKAAVCCSFPRG